MKYVRSNLDPVIVVGLLHLSETNLGRSFVLDGVLAMTALAICIRAIPPEITGQTFPVLVRFLNCMAIPC